MTYELVLTPEFLDHAERFLAHHPQLRHAYDKTLVLLQADPHPPSLRHHVIEHARGHLRSASINLQYRITFRLDDQVVTPVAIGTHDDVYRGD